MIAMQPAEEDDVKYELQREAPNRHLEAQHDDFGGLKWSQETTDIDRLPPNCQKQSESL